MSDSLQIWTIYDHPTDYPNTFVARMFVVDEKGARPTAEVITSDVLYTLREAMVARGLVCIMRSPDDSPGIVETWL